LTIVRPLLISCQLLVLLLCTHPLLARQSAPANTMPVSQVLYIAAALLLALLLVLLSIVWRNSNRRLQANKQIEDLTIEIGHLQTELKAQADALVQAQRANKQLKTTFDTRVKERTQQLEEKNYTLRQAHTELAKQKSELEQYAYAISHELKTPLVSIGGFLGFLSKDIAQPERAEMDVKHIKAAHRQMSTALDNLLLFMRIGQKALEKESLPIDELIHDLWKQLKHPDKVRIHFEVMPDMPKVAGNADYLAEALKQLLDNAIKYAAQVEAPAIKVGYLQKEGLGAFFIRDNGPGIPSQYQKKIFVLFERLQQQVPGTGIGLTLAQRIIEWHGGQIWVQSTEGQGATFYFSLQ